MTRSDLGTVLITNYVCAPHPHATVSVFIPDSSLLCHTYPNRPLSSMTRSDLGTVLITNYVCAPHPHATVSVFIPVTHLPYVTHNLTDHCRHI